MSDRQAREPRAHLVVEVQCPKTGLGLILAKPLLCPGLRAVQPGATVDLVVGLSRGSDCIHHRPLRHRVDIDQIAFIDNQGEEGGEEGAGPPPQTNVH